MPRLGNLRVIGGISDSAEQIRGVSQRDLGVRRAERGGDPAREAVEFDHTDAPRGLQPFCEVGAEPGHVPALDEVRQAVTAAAPKVLFATHVDTSTGVRVDPGPLARLAREAELCYAMVAMPTDYDCWKNDGHHDATLLEEIGQNLRIVSGHATDLIKRTISAIGRASTGTSDVSCSHVRTEPAWRGASSCAGAAPEARTTERATASAPTRGRPAPGGTGRGCRATDSGTVGSRRLRSARRPPGEACREEDQRWRRSVGRPS